MTNDSQNIRHSAGYIHILFIGWTRKPCTYRSVPAKRSHARCVDVRPDRPYRIVAMDDVPVIWLAQKNEQRAD